MKHVFIETNWVVDYAAPAHHQKRDAVDLLERARRREIALHLPAICITEARNPIRKNCQPRNEADAIRRFLSWSATRGIISEAEAQTVRRVLGMFENQVRAELDRLPATLEQLRSDPGLDVFPLDDEMLTLTAELTTMDLQLEPFDQAILAAILVRSDALHRAGESDIAFCELDHHLQPWDKQGNLKQPLKRMYDQRAIWVYGDFTLTTPNPYDGWPPLPA